MINNLITPNIPLFVFGTLRVGGRLDYYMEGSTPNGLFYTEGQLMESENGSAYIDFSQTQAATIGELHYINYFCLQRINHLESTWGEFPKAYDLGLIPIWNMVSNEAYEFNEQTQTLALCYKRREAARILSGDWTLRKNPIEEIGRFLSEETDKMLYHSDLIAHMGEYLKNYR